MSLEEKSSPVCERNKRNFVLIQWQYTCTVVLVINIMNSKTDRQLKNKWIEIAFLRNPFPGNAWIYNKTDFFNSLLNSIATGHAKFIMHAFGNLSENERWSLKNLPLWTQRLEAATTLRKWIKWSKQWPWKSCSRIAFLGAAALFNLPLNEVLT